MLCYQTATAALGRYFIVKVEEITRAQLDAEELQAAISQRLISCNKVKESIE